MPFPEPRTVMERGQDKARKRRFIGARLRSCGVDDVTVVFLDADDLVHRDLVRYVIGDGQGSYVVDNGYVYDTRSKTLQRHPENFHRRCGSSFIFRFGRDELPTSFDDVGASFSWFGTSPAQYGHQDYDLAARRLGRPPAEIPFAACVYVVNHPDSLWMAETGGKLRVNSRPRDVVWPGEARRILRDEFSTDDAAAPLSGPLGVTEAVVRASVVAVQTRIERRLRVLAPRQA